MKRELLKEHLFEDYNYFKQEDKKNNYNGVTVTPVLIKSDNSDLKKAEEIEIFAVNIYGRDFFTLPEYTIQLYNKKDFKNNFFMIGEVCSSLAQRYYDVKIKKFTKMIYNKKMTDFIFLSVNGWWGEPNKNRNVKTVTWINILNYINDENIRKEIKVSEKLDGVIRDIYEKLIKK